ARVKCPAAIVGFQRRLDPLVDQSNLIPTGLWPILRRHEPPLEIFLHPAPDLALGASRLLILKSRKVESGLWLRRAMTSHAILFQNRQYVRPKRSIAA